MRNTPPILPWPIRACLSRAQARLLPSSCLLCDEPAASTLDLCVACARALPWIESACPRCAIPVAPEDHGVPCGACQQRHALTNASAALLYQWPVDVLHRRFKFSGDLASGRSLARLMACRFAPACVGHPVLVPIPLHRDRLRRRGYDQAAELARPLATLLGLECRLVLRRGTATVAQSSLDASARQRNVRDAFQCVAPAPAHVVLVDDVMTTGATLHAAARASLQAGARRVDAWVCARVP